MPTMVTIQELEQAAHVCSIDGAKAHGVLLAFEVCSRETYERECFVVFSTSSSKARYMVTKYTNWEFIDLLAKRLPDADKYIDKERVSFTDTEADQRMYRDLGYRLTDSHCCEECGEDEWGLIPETVLVDGVCLDCREQIAKDPACSVHFSVNSELGS